MRRGLRRALLRAVRRALFVIAPFAPAMAHAERPSAWLFRATPGFGYSWDRGSECPVEGRMFVGGFHIGRFVTPSLLVGGGLGIGFNALPADGCDRDGSGLRMTMGMVLGPTLDWYPTERGFHVAGTAGVATFDQDNMSEGVGAGGLLAIGYDWAVDQHEGTTMRLGLLAQVTAVAASRDHSIVMPALLFSFAAD